MTDFSDTLAADRGQAARSIQAVKPSEIEDWTASLSPRAAAAVAAHPRFGQAGTHVILPGANAEEWQGAVVVPEPPSIWQLASLPGALPAGTYRLEGGDPGDAALGWALGHYQFDRYLSDNEPASARTLLVPSESAALAVQREAEAQALVRDLVNTPAEDMGPVDLEEAALKLGRDCAAQVSVIRGDDLLAENHPTIHAVGRAAAPGREPRLIDLSWGRSGDPKLTIVGKGVCFDSGGLDVKSAAGMRLMKKDMGGAAHALALAQLVMQAALPVRLRLLIPAVENSVSANALRPGDVVKTRAGLSVEIHNTDAEGRLVLCDALALAEEDEPDLIIDYATLTGAARVALGPDLPAMFARSDSTAEALIAAGRNCDDPVWRMPLWEPYQALLKSDIADVANAATTPFAGAVTAALYLARFVDVGRDWVHFDTYAWMPNDKPGRPKGGEALGLRAAFRMIADRYAAQSRSN